MKKSESLRFELETLKISVMLAIEKLLVKNNDELFLKDNQGSIIVNAIDDQESEVIHRIWLKYHDHKAVIIAGVGVYEEDYDVPVEDYGMDMLLNILEAAEMASEEIERGEKLDELEIADKN